MESKAPFAGLRLRAGRFVTGLLVAGAAGAVASSLVAGCSSSTSSNNSATGGSAGTAGSNAGGSGGTAGTGSGVDTSCGGQGPSCYGDDLGQCCASDPYLSTCVSGEWKCSGDGTVPRYVDPPGCDGTQCTALPQGGSGGDAGQAGATEASNAGASGQNEGGASN